MPSSSTKQAKVMSAIAHGWKPKGSVAKIPVKVAKDFHKADAGHKYGQKHKVTSARNTARKYAKKADGGATDEEKTPDFSQLKKVYISPNEGLAEDLTRKSPLEGREPPGPQFSATPETPRDTIRNFIAGPDTKSYEPRSVLANKAMNVLDYTPPMMAEQAGEDIAKGEYQNAALFALPGAKKAKAGLYDLEKALGAAANYAVKDEGPTAGQQYVQKALKAEYGKTLATKAIEKGYTPEQVENLKTYMTPGAQANFDKHYSKMSPKKEPSFEPSLWETPDIQATKPNLTVVPKAPPTLGIHTNKFTADAGNKSTLGKWSEYDALHAQASQMPLNLNEEQKGAVAYWGDPSGYKAINGHLRGSAVSFDASKAIPHLDSAIESSPLPSHSILWRGVHGPHADELKKLGAGDTFWNAGYTATSLDPRRATHYGLKEDPGIILNYHLPEGFPALYTSHPDAGGWSQNEREFLLPHGTPFRVIGTEKIKSPIWDYNGGVKDKNHHDFIVYHVAPADDYGPVHSQLDKVPGGKPLPAKPSKVPEQAPDDWYEQHNGPAVKPEPKGKDTDIEDYYAKMEKENYEYEKSQEQHELGPEWEPDYGDMPHAEEHIAPHLAGSDPYHQHLQGKLSPLQYTQAVRQHFVPSNYAEYRPKDVKPEEVPQVDWGKNSPEEVAEKGFNPNTILLKGGQWDSWTGGPFKPGGYPKEIIDPSQKHSEQAFHMATKPGIAEAYHGSKDIGGPYVAKSQNFLEFDWPSFFGSNHYSNGDLDKVTREARKMGADMVAVHNMHDTGSHLHGLHTQYLVLNTNILRAPHAAFDPEKWHLRHPLASIAGLTAGAGIYSYGDEAQAAEHKKEGGSVKKKDEDPKDHEFIDFKRGGLIDSDIPGRSDHIPMRVVPGSYVLPADIPSALGQGNTKAGSEILKKMFTHSAYGMEPMKGKGKEFRYPHPITFKRRAGGGRVAVLQALPKDHQLGMKVPKGGSMCANCKYIASPTTCGNKGFIEWNKGPNLPHPADEYCCDNYGIAEPKGKADGGETDHVPIIAAGGEWVIHPDDVTEQGHGDMNKGHKVLDQFVLHTRAQHIKTLKGLKGPKK